MKSLTKTYLINAPVSAVWDALVNPEVIDEWGGGPAIMNGEEDSEFSLWDGDIYGRNLSVTPQEELVQEWSEGDWPQPSLVTFKLKEVNPSTGSGQAPSTGSGQAVTEVTLTHDKIPEDEVKDIDEGWDLYYLGAIKNLLEE